MRVYPEKLAAQLKKQLLPVYLISGEEPLVDPNAGEGDNDSDQAGEDDDDTDDDGDE